jgi:serine/threonine protein kinase
MKCPEQEFVEHYIQGQLAPEALSDFEAHLQTCKNCRTRVAEARENEKILAEIRTFERTSSEPHEPGSKEISTIDQAQSLLGQRYRVIRKIGEGAAGHVFQVADTVLDRLVAVKFLRKKDPISRKDFEMGTQKVSTDEESSKRWQEARLMSRLNHPGVAQVYEIGEIEEQRFIVMEWVDGLPLTDAWKDLPLQQRLNIYLDVLNAVSAAHARGIIHRDIKPSNILVGSDHKPKILDFGIALETQYSAGVKQKVYRGTPAYTAPEQVTAPIQIFPSTDVFALGILLYELLTDTLPFPQTDPKKLFEAIKTQHPELPSAIRQKVPISLQNICLKALEKDPQNRYSTARDLADDINRYLRGEKVWSRPSFLSDKIQQEVFYHRQKLKVWRDNELITEKEFDRLENIYERVISPPDLSIIEARKLSFSQVCLYFGGWIVVLGSFVLFYKTWENIPALLRPLPAVAATTLMIILGSAMWKRSESRLAVGFLSTANLLIPITMLLTLAQWDLLSPVNYHWGTESIPAMLKEMKSYVTVGNAQLYFSSLCWFAFSLFFLRMTKSSIFVFFGIISFLAWLTSCYIIAGMIGPVDEFKPWAPEIIAGRYLYPGIGFFVLGVILDRQRFIYFAWPLCMVGLALIAICLSIIAISEATLFGWLWRIPGFLEEGEPQILSFTFNGLIYLVLAGVCRSLGTRLQRSLASILNWLGPIHILGTLRILDSQVFHISESHAFVYRVLLPIASIGFVFGSVARQMKSFFFSGLAGIATAVQRFTAEYLKDCFAWPVSLIITGIIWMLVSWRVPLWRANRLLKRAK